MVDVYYYNYYYYYCYYCYYDCDCDVTVVAGTVGAGAGGGTDAVDGNDHNRSIVILCFSHCYDNGCCCYCYCYCIEKNVLCLLIVQGTLYYNNCYYCCDDSVVVVVDVDIVDVDYDAVIVVMLGNKGVHFGNAVLMNNRCIVASGIHYVTGNAALAAVSAHWNDLLPRTRWLNVAAFDIRSH